MARYDLIAAPWPGTDDAGGQNATSSDTRHGFLHRFIVPNLEGMIFERKQLCQWNLPHLFAVGLRLAARLKQIVKPGQLYLTGAAFHDKTSCVNAV